MSTKYKNNYPYRCERVARAPSPIYRLKVVLS